jgi:hypothetical protein
MVIVVFGLVRHTWIGGREMTFVQLDPLSPLVTQLSISG